MQSFFNKLDVFVYLCILYLQAFIVALSGFLICQFRKAFENLLEVLVALKRFYVNKS